MIEQPQEPVSQINRRVKYDKRFKIPRHSQRTLSMMRFSNGMAEGFVKKMEEVGRKMDDNSEAKVKEAKARVRSDRDEAAANDLEVLTVLAQGSAMCDDVSTREQLHREMQLAMANILPGAHLAAAAPKGKEVCVPLSPVIISFAELPPDYIRIHDPATQQDTLAKMKAKISRLVQCGLLLTRTNLGGFDFYYLLLSRLEQVLVVKGGCGWGNAVGEFLDADGFELVRKLTQRAPPEYAGRLVHIICLLILRLIAPLQGGLSTEQRAHAPMEQLFADLRALIERAKQSDAFAAGVLCACILADKNLVKPLVEQGLLPYLVEYARRLQPRPRLDFPLQATQDELDPSSLTNILIAFAKLADVTEEYSTLPEPEQPYWHVPPPTPTSLAWVIRSSGIANVMQEALARGGNDLVTPILRYRLDWINLYATGRPEPLNCAFSDTPHCQTFSCAGDCERVQTFRFKIRVEGHVPEDDCEEGEDPAEEYTPQEKKRRLEKRKKKVGDKAATPLHTRARVVDASSVVLVAVPVNDPDAAETESMDEDAAAEEPEAAAEPTEFGCPMCEARFESARALERHVDGCGLDNEPARAAEPIYTCPLCSATFTDEGQAGVHVAICGDPAAEAAAWGFEDGRECPICEKKFSRLADLETHAGACGLPPSGSTGVAAGPSSSKANASAGSSKPKATAGNSESNTPANEAEEKDGSHFVLGPPLAPWPRPVLQANPLGGCSTGFRCPVCSLDFSTGTELIAHMRDTCLESAGARDSPPGARARRLTQCPNCDLDLCALTPLLAHLRACAVAFVCWKCGERFAAAAVRDAHQAQCAVLNGMAGACGPPRGHYRCDRCFKEFDTLGEARQHGESVCWPGKPGCEKCGSAFPSVQERFEHQAGCSTGRPLARPSAPQRHEFKPRAVALRAAATPPMDKTQSGKPEESQKTGTTGETSLRVALRRAEIETETDPETEDGEGFLQNQQPEVGGSIGAAATEGLGEDPGVARGLAENAAAAAVLTGSASAAVAEGDEDMEEPPTGTFGAEGPGHEEIMPRGVAEMGAADVTGFRNDDFERVFPEDAAKEAEQMRREDKEATRIDSDWVVLPGAEGGP
ncbi:hypothetical protein KFL_001130210 [Klebsormidium nitens]|uniref:C2H2-type domain-containing protein n=1 Tax=Klebsormidium nitens TaxID=105231 RepID=A0A0U9HM50_KLENI|nr:hypothetical protein KFL_001130210 [Klebsormidium nitens]|eukprot:GAQ82503.1 hypothetical protein KFL_001130210 [Klebsormidium nitens]